MAEKDWIKSWKPIFRRELSERYSYHEQIQVHTSGRIVHESYVRFLVGNLSDLMGGKMGFPPRFHHKLNLELKVRNVV